MKNLIILFLILIILIIIVYNIFKKNKIEKIENIKNEENKSSFQELINLYFKKPKYNKRVVLIINCDEENSCKNFIDKETIKTIISILNQNIRVDNIAIQINKPEKFKKILNPLLKNLISFHYPNTEKVREMENETITINLIKGKEYPYNYIQNKIFT